MKSASLKYQHIAILLGKISLCLSTKYAYLDFPLMLICAQGFPLNLFLRCANEKRAYCNKGQSCEVLTGICVNNLSSLIFLCVLMRSFYTVSTPAVLLGSRLQVVSRVYLRATSNDTNVSANCPTRLSTNLAVSDEVLYTPMPLLIMCCLAL